MRRRPAIVPAFFPEGSLPGKWVLEAACSPDQGDLFFSENAVDQEAAVALCERCPVLKDCGQWASRWAPDGLWAGRHWRKRVAGAIPRTAPAT